MSTYDITMYRPEHADKDEVLAFLLKLNRPPGAVPGFGIGEYVFSAWRDLDPPTTETLGIVRDAGGTVVALCWLEPPNEIAFSVLPDLDGTPDEGVLYRQLKPWATGRIARLCPDNAEPIGITIEAGDDADAGYLTELGLVTEGEIRHHTYRWLEGEPMDRAPLPEGYRFVALEDDGRVTERWRLHKAVWEQATLDDRRYTQVRSAPYYRRDLDLCVETDAGELVAFALGWLDPEGGSCQFEPIGTHPDHRGKGIGKALVKEATHRVRELGADRCYINCSAKNEAGNALYAAAGYALVGRWQWWHYPAAGEST